MNYELLKKNKVDAAAYHRVYASLIEAEIRKVYSLSDEIAILRQAQSKPDEFDKYNAYVEQCKSLIQSQLC